MYSVWREQIREIIKQELPPAIELSSKFLFSREEILLQAETEGYTLVRKLEGAKPDRCVMADWDHVRFYKRQVYKGKPSDAFLAHRDFDLPAIITMTEVSWCQNGEYSRANNKPAFLTTKDITWNLNGKWHRSDDGPTIINVYQGIRYHRNHEVWKRETDKGVEYPAGWVNGIHTWRSEP